MKDVLKIQLFLRIGFVLIQNASYTLNYTLLLTTFLDKLNTLLDE